MRLASGITIGVDVELVRWMLMAASTRARAANLVPPRCCRGPLGHYRVG